LLKLEYQNLFASLFKNHERHVAVVETLSKKAKGLQRSELANLSKQANGGTFTAILDELEHCGFIKKYPPFGKQYRDSLYQLVDPYTLFYLKFIKNSKGSASGSWLKRLHHPKWRSWSGYAFEYLCISHVESIKKCLGIAGVYSEISSWRSSQSKQGAQIDLIIDRDDRIINLCEIKFSESPYTITKSYAQNLQNKLWAFKEESKTRKTIFLTMICTFGLKENVYSNSLVQHKLDINALFE
ncbi:MAG: ATP-binding protein, partial [Bacteroidota bacterium]